MNQSRILPSLKPLSGPRVPAIRVLVPALLVLAAAVTTPATRHTAATSLALDDTVSAIQPATALDSQLPVQSMAFSSSRLYYTDQSLTDEPGLPLWRRTVSGKGAPSLSGPTLFTPRAAAPLGADSSVSFSAGRGAIGLPGKEFQWQLLDRQTITAYIEQHTIPSSSGQTRIHGVPTSSGPFTLVAGQIFRADGEFLYTEPDSGTGYDDIFGSKVIYSRMTAAGKASIYLVDATKPNPAKLAGQACSAPPMVAIWGTTAAWLNCDKAGFTVRNLTTKTSHQVSAGPGGAQQVSQMLLREGTLSWLNGGVSRVVDLRAAHPTPVAVAGTAQVIAVDDHRIALQAEASAGGGVTVNRLPFGGKYHPRLIGVLGPLGFTPNGDGHADTWKPEFDLTKPLAGVQLRITALKSGKVLRTLKGTGTDGSIRNLSWNGRTGGGRLLPRGTYRWQLVAKAADGDGAVIATNGVSMVTGTVEID